MNEHQNHGQRKERPGPPPELLNAPSKDEALQKLFDKWSPAPRTEVIPLTEAMGRVLAEDVRAQYNLPVFRCSSMDGVAINYESVKDGIPDTTKWQLGREFVRADTGDDFPDEYDTIVKIEEVTILPEGGLRFREGIEIQQGQSVRPCGSTLKAGKLLVQAGTKLGVLDLAAIGSGGYDQVKVVKRPRVAFLPTGSELVPIGSKLQRGQNFDTNSLVAQQLLLEMGAEPVILPLIRDDYDLLKSMIEKLTAENDIVIVNAGTSKGSEDFCPHVLEEIGEILFHGVRAVPGRPMCVALYQGKPVINLSGPSLAAFYGLEWAIKPIVAKALGTAAVHRETVTAELARPMGAPGFMSACVRMDLSRREDGSYVAKQMPGGRPGPGGQTPPVDLDAPDTAAGVYFTPYGVNSFEQGQSIEVMLVRNRETIV